MLLENRVAIVTGGNSGIGKGIALKFVQEGCSVVITGLSELKGKQAVEEISKSGSNIYFRRCDVTDSKQIQAVVNETVQKFGKIDILVNNAGGVPGNQGLLKDITEDLWHKVMDLDLKSVFLFSQTVVPYMQAQKYGKIVNVASIGAVHPSVSVNHYHAAKAGVLGLTTNMAFELANQNITVNAILPGPIRTPFWDPVIKGSPDPDAQFAAIAKKEIPMQRLGTPEDIAGPALFLASELSSYVTGQVLHVAGGQPLPIAT